MLLRNMLPSLKILEINNFMNNKGTIVGLNTEDILNDNNKIIKTLNKKYFHFCNSQKSQYF